MTIFLRRSLALLSLAVLALPASATVTISSGTVTITNPNLAGAGEEVQVSNATLDLNGQANVIAGQISLLGSFTILANNDTAHEASYAGPVVIGSNTRALIGGEGDLTLTGPLALNGGQFEVYTAFGTLRLTGTHTGDGGTVTIDGGLLDIGNRLAFGNYGDIYFNGGTMRLGSGDYRTGPGFYGYYFTSGGYDVQLDVAAGQTALIANLSFESNGGALRKSGAGTLSINNSAIFPTISIRDGQTLVDAGTLLVDGTLTRTTVSVAAGATLSGTGTISGPTTLASGAHLAPSQSPAAAGTATLTFTQGLTLNNGAVLDLKLGAVSDLIAVTGGTLTGPGTPGGITLNLSDAGGFAAGTYTLINYATATNLSASSFALGTTIAGYNYQFTASGGMVQLIATSAIPEPSTYAALAGLGALGLVAIRRGRRIA